MYYFLKYSIIISIDKTVSISKQLVFLYFKQNNLLNQRIMTTNLKTKPPVWFWIVSVLALIWNLIGVSFYLMDAYMRDETIAGLSETQKNIIESQPSWVIGAYALAVFGGALGCIALLIRKKWAKQLFVVSFVAMAARTIYYFFMTNATEVFDVVQGTLMPIIILIITGFLFILSRIAIEKKWIF